MIQRIQTLFLIATVFLNGAYLFTPLYDKILDDPTGWIAASHSTALLLASGLSIACIGFYKNRIKQINWVKMAILFQIIAVASGFGVLFSLGGIGRYLWDEFLSHLIIITSGILLISALGFIKKDEELVKSIDRIR